MPDIIIDPNKECRSCHADGVIKMMDLCPTCAMALVKTALAVRGEVINSVEDQVEKLFIRNLVDINRTFDQVDDHLDLNFKVRIFVQTEKGITVRTDLSFVASRIKDVDERTINENQLSLLPEG